MHTLSCLRQLSCCVLVVVLPRLFLWDVLRCLVGFSCLSFRLGASALTTAPTRAASVARRPLTHTLRQPVRSRDPCERPRCRSVCLVCFLSFVCVASHAFSVLTYLSALSYVFDLLTFVPALCWKTTLGLSVACNILPSASFMVVWSCCVHSRLAWSLASPRRPAAAPLVC